MRSELDLPVNCTEWPIPASKIKEGGGDKRETGEREDSQQRKDVRVERDFQNARVPHAPANPRRQIPLGSPLPTHTETRETRKQQAQRPPATSFPFSLERTGAQAHQEPRGCEPERRENARWQQGRGWRRQRPRSWLRSGSLPRTPASVYVTVSMEIPRRGQRSGSRRLGLTRPPADGDSSVALAVAAAVEAAGAARLPLPFAHSARPAVVVVPAVAAAVAPFAAAKAAAAVASQNAVTRQRPTSLHHHAATR
ncbi:uncharacterized protein [Equus przewalskii]|uniref:Uncharacterized protein n=1 Tax=Equus przewalskii TaxID=9798 RepID=A0ABM4LIG6_EQUPR